MPFARILVFALALTHAVGLADLVLDDPCEELCREDGCASDCLPGALCRCHCPSAMAMLEASMPIAAAIAAPPALVPPHGAEWLYASPDPREILRVPKLSA